MAVSQRIDILSGVPLIHRPEYYFGAGFEADPNAMEAITGRPLVHETGVIAVERCLAVQEFDQIPDQSSPELGDRSAQQILRAAWSAHTDVPFSSHALLPSENRSDIVEGTLYELLMDDALALADWHLATPNLRDAAWRCWDRSIELADGRRSVSTLTVRPNQKVDRIVPGIGYVPYLNGKDATHRVIQDFVRMRKADS